MKRMGASNTEKMKSWGTPNPLHAQEVEMFYRDSEQSSESQWKEYTEQEGSCRKYYHNAAEDKTSWEKPEELYTEAEKETAAATAGRRARLLEKLSKKEDALPNTVGEKEPPSSSLAADHEQYNPIIVDAPFAPG